MSEQRFSKSIFEDKLAGFSFTTDHAHRMLICGKLLKAMLVREPDNPYDANAVRVDVNGVKVGYVPRGKTSYRAYGGLTCGWADYSKAGEKNVAIAKALDGGIRLAAAVQWDAEWKVNTVDMEGNKTKFYRKSDYTVNGFPPRLYIFGEEFLPAEAENFPAISEEALTKATQFVNFAKISYMEPGNQTILWEGGDLYYVKDLNKFAVWGGQEVICEPGFETVSIKKFLKTDFLPFHVIEEADIHFDKLALCISPSYEDKMRKIEELAVKALEQIPGNHSGNYEFQNR